MTQRGAAALRFAPAWRHLSARYRWGLSPMTRATRRLNYAAFVSDPVGYRLAAHCAQSAAQATDAKAFGLRRPRRDLREVLKDTNSVASEWATRE